MSVNNPEERGDELEARIEAYELRLKALEKDIATLLVDARKFPTVDINEIRRRIREQTDEQK